MVKLTNNGVTVLVTPSDVDFYKRAGYVEVEDAVLVVPQSVAPDAPQELSEMTLEHLRDYAKEQGLSDYSSLRKAELLALLQGEAE